jgi:hypothetical protein
MLPPIVSMNQIKNSGARQGVARRTSKCEEERKIVASANSLRPAFGVDGLVKIDPEHSG